ncbi:angiotensin-converting enzyme [Trichonephila inaurata madagascariensis]|uniref:Angiotensin-converting enzyme n=1 Tax=Trichonephila inaurata madagascariensis TaxID=2747483 RepID=A0A8X6WNH5_9ARAC|nr:angiotensin-converting enzyme [Trichonephila inaurata madagascariensis]
MSTSRNPSELEYYWKKFREETGEKYKDLFKTSVERGNREAKGSGYKDKAELRISKYEDKNFLQNIATEVNKMMPLYKEIHAYVRRKLIKFYKNETIMKDGPIPAHLLGNMYAQKWFNIYSIITPYPNIKDETNITDVMLEKKMEPIDMFMMAENFFYSIGMKNMTARFWKNSLIEKPKDGRVVNCHASAHSMVDGKDFRIKMCSTVDAPTLATVHHEMGHIEYYMHYSHLPYVFQESANPAVENQCKIIESAILSKCNMNQEMREGGRQALGELKSSVYRNFVMIKSEKFVEACKESLKDVMSSLPKKTYSSVVAPSYGGELNKPSRKTCSVLIEAENCNSDDARKLFKAQINPRKENIGILYVKEISDSRIIINCDSKKDRDKLMTTIEANPKFPKPTVPQRKNLQC